MIITNASEALAAINGLAVYERFEVRGKNGGGKRRAVKQEDGRVGIFAPKSTRRGNVVSAEWVVNNYDVVITTVEEAANDWKKRLARAVKCLEKSGLWTNIKEIFANLLTVDYNDWCDLKTYTAWGSDITEAYNKYAEKYPFVFAKTDDGEIRIKTDYVYELSECKLKSMYFGDDNSYIKSQIAERLAAKETYRSPRVIVSYDVTYEYSAEKNCAWYSEEYRNCGNGHYYLALDENTAVFCEND